MRQVRKESKSSAEVSDYPDSKHKTYHKKNINCRPPFPPIIKLSKLISMSPGFASKYKEMSVYKENPIQMNLNCDCNLSISIMYSLVIKNSQTKLTTCYPLT